MKYFYKQHFFSLSLLFPLVTLGQQTSSAIIGKISGAKNEGLPEATVQILYLPTNA